MKQSEINKELKAITKLKVKQLGWKSINRMPYWTIGPLFFNYINGADSTEGFYYGELRFKWLDLDYALWRVLGMTSNKNEPFSLHANGAFVIFGEAILTISQSSLVWTSRELSTQVDNALQQSQVKAYEIATKVNTLDHYQKFMHEEYEKLLERNPQTAKNLRREDLLIAILQNDFVCAAEIAKLAISTGDSGGFYDENNRTFFECALNLCEQQKIESTTQNA